MQLTYNTIVPKAIVPALGVEAIFIIGPNLGLDAVQQRSARLVRDGHAVAKQLVTHSTPYGSVFFF
jgi:hypothetical protein